MGGESPPADAVTNPTGGGRNATQEAFIIHENTTSGPAHGRDRSDSQRGHARPRPGLGDLAGEGSHPLFAEGPKVTTLDTPRVYESSSSISRFNAWFFDVFDGFLNMCLGRLKREVYADLPDTIVEIGPGVGGNFHYYPPGATVIAIEPNLTMHERLEKNAVKAGLNLVLQNKLAEDTGLPTGSASVVISNLVLCTVTDPGSAIAEAHRILEPGGRFIVVEHVHGQGRTLRGLQRLVRRPWRWLFEGCELDRDTRGAIASAGFSRVDITERTYVTPFIPINSFAYGTATK